MTRIFACLIALAAVAVTAASVGAAGPPAAIYDSSPSPLPPNVVSLGYQATATAEFGDRVTFAGTNRRLTSVTVTMSDWAKHSDYPSLPAAGYTHPITLNLYNAGTGSNPGSLIASVTQNFLIPWRPEADPTCATPSAWRAPDNLCYSGLAFDITFDLNQTVPDSIVYGIAYDTNTWGYDPIGAHGPYESLNVGLTPAATTGTNDDPDDVFWNTAHAGFYTDGGAAGVGIFRRDTGWAGLVPAAKFVASAAVATSRDGCKGNGWQSLGRADGSTFKNQGDCIQYVNTGK
jgi:hypothetical protein